MNRQEKYVAGVPRTVRQRVDFEMSEWRAGGRQDGQIEDIVRRLVLVAYEVGIADAMAPGNCTYTLEEVEEMGWVPPGRIPAQADEYHPDSARLICPRCGGEWLDSRQHGEGWCGPPTSEPPVSDQPEDGQPAATKLRAALDGIASVRRDGRYNTGEECREIALRALEAPKHAHRFVDKALLGEPPLYYAAAEGGAARRFLDVGGVVVAPMNITPSVEPPKPGGPSALNSEPPKESS